MTILAVSRTPVETPTFELFLLFLDLHWSPHNSAVTELIVPGNNNFVKINSYLKTL